MRWAEENSRTQAALARARRHHLGEDLARQRVLRRPSRTFTGRTPRRRAAWQIVMDESFDLNSKDFKPVLDHLKAVNADVVLVDAHRPITSPCTASTRRRACATS